MMTRRIYILLPLILLFANTFSAKSQEYCSFLKRVQEYQKGVKLLDHKNDECNPAEVDTTTFNIKTYLSLFDQLRLVPNRELWLCNFYGYSAGQPIMYVRPKDFKEDVYFLQAQKKFNAQMDSILGARSIIYSKDSSTKKELAFIKKWVDRQKSCFTPTAALIQYARDSVNRAEYNFIPNDTKNGFIQLLFFNRMGSRFALYWHSNYQLMSIICDQQDVQYHLADCQKQGSNMTFEEEKFKEQSLIDVSPKVSVSNDAYYIEWYEFEFHEGLYKRSFKIERQAPYRITLVREERVVKTTVNYFY